MSGLLELFHVMSVSVMLKQVMSLYVSLCRIQVRSGYVRLGYVRKCDASCDRLWQVWPGYVRLALVM